MARRSKIAIFVPIVLLLVRSLFPVVQGQILPLEWNHKSDPVKLYRQQMVYPAADRALLPSSATKYWTSVLDQAPIGSGRERELMEFPVSLKNVGLHPHQLYPSAYILLKEQMHPPPQSIPSAVSGIDALEALSSKLYYQQPTKRRDQQKETDALQQTGSGPPVDYSSDDETSAQLVQPASNTNPTDYSQPPPPKAKIKQRQPLSADGLARYLIFSNLKRARDGYICHFKLCQVGVSGKRLSTDNDM